MPSYFKRQENCDQFDDYGNCYSPFWWSNTGLAIRYGVVGGIFVLCCLFLLGGYIHARRRIKKGLPPLRYHRWLVARRHRPQYTYQNGYNMPARAQDGYNYAPGPPAYNAWDGPPQYQPPLGGSKVSANQNVRGVDGTDGAGSSHVQYPAPAHAPPQETMREV